MLVLWLAAICLIVAGAGIGRKAPFPDAVIWCAAGFCAAFLPQFAHFTIDPALTLFVLLPPLVYASAVRLPWSEFRENLRPISLLAVGLVLVNTAAVAVVAHHLAQLSWPVATALGAIISPTDPVAASAIAQRVGLPRRLVAILEGEGLVNDAVALTILALSLSAAAGGGFSIAGGVLRFFAILIGEPVYGCLVAIAILFLRVRIEDPRLEITVSLLTPFAAYLLPRYLGGSGILATVAAGMYIGERLSDVVPAGTRLRSTSVWEVVVFLLNGLLFLLAGIELRRVIQPDYLNRQYLVWGVAVAALVVFLRAAWCGIAWLLFRGRSLLREAESQPMPGRHMLIVAWSGMRGPVSLAAALSVPALADGARLPHFETLLFITAVVIGVTLVAQGLGLPYLVRALDVTGDAARDRRQEREQLALGEAEAARTAIQRLAQLEADRRVARELAERLRRYYNDRLTGDFAGAGGRGVRRQLLDAERARIRELRQQGRINEHALQELERELDLREGILAMPTDTAP